MKTSQKELPKNLKDFANKRQVKHTSTVLEPSIPFHTLVKLVDAEDIANDKIRTPLRYICRKSGFYHQV